jgi:hypothetical protein
VRARLSVIVAALAALQSRPTPERVDALLATILVGVLQAFKTIK